MMNNKNPSTNSKYSLYIEGQTEGWFIKNLKTELLKIKNKTICKKHTKIQSGACSDKSLKQILESNNCCTTFIIFDDENDNKQRISNYINSGKNLKKNDVYIINKPCFEINLLMFFQRLDINANLDSEQICHLINRHLKELNAKFKYKHNIEFLENMVRLIKQKNLIQDFEDNLKYYHDQWNNDETNKNFSTLYALIDFLKK